MPNIQSNWLENPQRADPGNGPGNHNYTSDEVNNEALVAGCDRVAEHNDHLRCV